MKRVKSACILQTLVFMQKEDGSIIVRVRKQYNDKADVSEYFQ